MNAEKKLLKHIENFLGELNVHVHGCDREMAWAILRSSDFRELRVTLERVNEPHTPRNCWLLAEATCMGQKECAHCAGWQPYPPDKGIPKPPTPMAYIGEMPEVKPTVGRIVHWVNENGGHYAALVVGFTGPYANLRVFCGDPSLTPSNDQLIYKTLYSSKPEKGTWHWPEREE